MVSSPVFSPHTQGQTLLSQTGPLISFKSDDVSPFKSDDGSLSHLPGPSLATMASEDIQNQVEQLEEMCRQQQMNETLEALHEGRRHRSGLVSGADSHQMPLLQTGVFDEVKYKPYALGDLTTLCDKLPPITEGAGLWLQALSKLTAGTTLAMGDYRAVAARCMTSSAAREVELSANTALVSDVTRFTKYSDIIGKALREKFPIPQGSGIPKFTWNPEKNTTAVSRRVQSHVGKSHWC